MPSATESAPIFIVVSLYAQLRGHHVRLTGSERPGLLAYVGRLHAQHLRPLVVAEVRHRARLVDPGVPHDRRGRACLLYCDATAPAGILDRDGGRGVEVDAVRLGGN